MLVLRLAAIGSYRTRHRHWYPLALRLQTTRSLSTPKGAGMKANQQDERQ